MFEFLQNEKVQMVLAGLLVVLVERAIAWLKTLTMPAIVNEWWTYVKPIVDKTMEELRDKHQQTGVLPDATAAKNIENKGVAAFADAFRKYEGSDPSDRIVAAIRTELASVIASTLGLSD